MQNITIGRYDKDPEAQGAIKPEDDSWQLVIDKEGYPHLFVKINVEGAEGPTTGMFCIEDMLPEKMTTKDLMLGTFGGELTGEEAEQAEREYNESGRQIPCPRL